MEALLLFGKIVLQNFGKGVLSQMISCDAAEVAGEKKTSMTRKDKNQLAERMVGMVVREKTWF